MDKVRVFATKIDTSKSFLEYENFLDLISEQRQQNISKKLFDKDKISSLFSELLLFKVLKDYYYLNPSDLIIKKTKYNKPYLANIDNVHYNISHSGDWVVCAVSPVPVGVDIEKIVDIDFSLISKYYSTKEIHEFKKVPKQHKLACFYNLWTLKESYIKAVGMGLSIPLDSFSIIKESNSFKLVSQNKVNYNFKQYEIDAEYKLSVCSINNAFSLKAIVLYL